MLAGCQAILDIEGEFKDDSDLFTGKYSLKFNYFCNTGKKWNPVDQEVQVIKPLSLKLEPIAREDYCMNATSIIAGLKGDTPPATLQPTPAPTAAPTETPGDGAGALNASMLMIAFSCFLLMISM